MIDRHRAPAGFLDAPKLGSAEDLLAEPIAEQNSPSRRQDRYPRVARQAALEEVVAQLGCPVPVEMCAQHADDLALRVEHRCRHVDETQRLAAGAGVQKLLEQQGTVHVDGRGALQTALEPGPLRYRLALEHAATGDPNNSVGAGKADPGVVRQSLLHAFEDAADASRFRQPNLAQHLEGRERANLLVARVHEEIKAFGDGGRVVGHLVTDEALNAIVRDRRGADREQASEDETQDRGCGADLLAHSEAVLEGAQLALQLVRQRRLQGSPVASPRDADAAATVHAGFHAVRKRGNLPRTPNDRLSFVRCVHPAGMSAYGVSPWPASSASTTSSSG